MRLTASRVSCREFQRGHRPVTHAVVVIVIIVVDSEMRQRLRGRTARIEIITRAMIRFRIPVADVSHPPLSSPFPELVGSRRLSASLPPCRMPRRRSKRDGERADKTPARGSDADAA